MLDVLASTSAQNTSRFGEMLELARKVRNFRSVALTQRKRNRHFDWIRGSAREMLDEAARAECLGVIFL